ncbi:TlpA family protein disulfide reductase [Pedobacter sp.]|uniref:TlpA family protein disulfide reductase n=1 Tax=Pedobacter sp. TaxID=1411316 RepID=UPI003BA8ECF3
MKNNAIQKAYWPNIDSATITNGKAKLKRDTLLADASWASGICYIDTLTKKKETFVFKNNFNSKRKSRSFILENGYINISGDIKNPEGLNIDGSLENELNMRYGLLGPNISGVNKRMDEADKKNDSKLLAAALSAKKDSLESFKKKLNKLAEQYPSSWIILLNVYQNASRFTPSELEEISAKFSKSTLETPKGKSLINFTKQTGKLVRGAVFPQFNYSDAVGKKWTLDDVKGKNGTLVIFWASWCGPCRKEIPELKKIHQTYKAKGINLVSISTDHDIAAWKLAMKQEAMGWMNLSNLPGDSKLINSTYNLYAIPSVYLLDAQNNIVMPDEYEIPKIEEHLRKLVEKG